MTQNEDQRWWIDRGPNKKGEAVKKASLGAGGAAYDELSDYDQERVRESLADSNLRLLRDVDPSAGTWHYLTLRRDQPLLADFHTIRKALPLSDPLRGVAIDCGFSLRLLITGEPLGEKILEVQLSDRPSFDLWERGNLVREALFASREEALEAIPAWMTSVGLPAKKEFIG